MSKAAANIIPALPNRLYDWGQRFAKLFLPAAGALYFGLSQIWGLPKGEEVVGTLALLTVFLGAVLAMSKATWKDSGAAYDGEFEFGELGDQPSLNLNKVPEVFYGQDEVRLKVKRAS